MSAYELNLLPESTLKKMILRRTLRNWIIPATILVIGLVAVGLMLSVELQTIKRNLKQAKVDFRPTSLIVDRADEVLGEIVAVQKQQAKFDRLNFDRDPMTHLKVIAKSAKACRGVIVLGNFNFQSSKPEATSKKGVQPAGHNPATPELITAVTLSGTSNSDLTIAEFIDGLKNSGLFTDVQLKSSTQIQRNGDFSKSFSIEARFQPEVKS